MPVLLDQREMSRSMIEFCHEDEANFETTSEAHQTGTPLQPVTPVATLLPPLPDLPQISRVLRLQKYQRRQLCDLQAELRSLQLATSRSSRLAKMARSVHRTMAECVRSEDKPSFVSLFSTFHDVADEPAEERAHTVVAQSVFLDRLPDHHRAVVLKLLYEVHSNGAFVADRLAALTHREILALLPERGSTRSTASVLDSSRASYSRASHQLGYVIDGQMDSLSSLAFGSHLETLIFAVDGHSGTLATDASRALEIWSTVCAHLIAIQKPGSEKLVPAVLDLWAASTTWPGRQRLELWMLQILQRGAFLLEQPSKQSFRMRIQVRPAIPAQEDLEAEAFYADAVNELLELLSDFSGVTVIPQPAIDMCHEIWKKLSPGSGHQRGLSRFLLTRWLFSSFMLDAVVLPEAFGILSDHYVSENARSRILREIAIRTQKAVFDVTHAWKHGNIVPLDLASRVDAVMLRLDFSCPYHRPSVPLESNGAVPSKKDEFLIISATDVATTIRVLYPSRRPESLTSEQSGLQSSASSISGFSVFTSLTPLEQPFAAPTTFTPGPKGQYNVPVRSRSTSNLLGDFSHAAQSVLDTELLDEALRSVEDTIGQSGSTWDNWAVLLLSPHHETLLEPEAAAPEHLFHWNDEAVADLDDHRVDTYIAILQYLVTSIPASDVRITDCPTSSRPSGALNIYEHLLHTMEDICNNAKDNADFLGAHYWYEQLQHFRGVCKDGIETEGLMTVLAQIEAQAQLTLTNDGLSMDTCTDWLRLTMQALEPHASDLAIARSTADNLRDKMWFIADVRTSAPYDEARSIASALRVMGRSTRQMRSRFNPPLRHWSNTKLPTASFQLKTDAQVLELLSASPEQGGSGKLSDDQARATLNWLESNNVEILCPAEERLHRLCMEVRKCVEQLTAVDGTLLFSNPLFARELSRSEARDRLRSASHATAGRLRHLPLRTNIASSIDALSSTSQQLSSASSREYLESRSPTLTHKSSAPFWSPATTEVRSPSSATSMGSYYTHPKPHISTKLHTTPRNGQEHYGTVEDLRRSLTALLLSDLSSTLFSDGSETDQALWTGLGGEVTDKYIASLDGDSPSLHITSGEASQMGGQIGAFDFLQAFERMLSSFTASSSPSAKLSVLYDIDQLLPLYMNESHPHPPKSHSARRVDASIEGFRRLFCNTRLRPAAIFRDLQYIAALVPANILESTPEGKAFCNAAVAITSLKQELRNVMVETADSIIAYHSNNRGHGRASSTAQQQRDSAAFTAPSRTPPLEDIARYKMSDAAYLLQITAKEGDPVAQRELATLYMTHPELMDQILAPFARPRDVFKAELESKWRKNQDPNRCDPATMCVAHHWMVLSSKGGDALAKEYLRAREEMERLP
ncbi:hypothetical protein LTR91_008821 [Friedmanniomyces endolithicus]|uniref:Uncharacterized protein n=1 Tax=Friedmanniomyces endolithicus TaxID=329885 RepID=A0AAN6KMP2_9PEZI|nr:hypothetical protein LTR35_001265 [Friedmanniomyces endolithicus]KAK0296487.1 hypothetical protein LTS00_004812 [Friedmanniomyces endolithicus]KAK0324554.1 hypothetical protein LTR82_004259 [Friedmanniomyces endolithicus]KAK0932028.1 hypothetical protein LTR57_000248 [Friedmanniomyces endolithicus]KAK0990879.1 hypothetical protein LTR91_008821 [Friedmanniomyces endolithicus]